MKYKEFLIKVGIFLHMRSCIKYIEQDMSKYLKILNERYGEVDGEWRNANPKHVAEELLKNKEVIK